MNVARSIIQEKTSRIFEVMLATARPSDMLAGKLIGVGAVGLTQIVIWVVTGTALLVSPLAAALLTGDFAVHFSWAEGVLFPVYFVLGLFCSIVRCLRASRPPARRSRNCRCTCHWPRAPTWLSFSMILLIVKRFEFDLVGPRLAVPAYRADCHVSAHGFPDSAALAVCAFHQPHGPEHLGHAVGFFAALQGRNPDVWQAGHTAGTGALASLLVSGAKSLWFWTPALESSE